MLAPKITAVEAPSRGRNTTIGCKQGQRSGAQHSFGDRATPEVDAAHEHNIVINRERLDDYAVGDRPDLANVLSVAEGVAPGLTLERKGR